MSERESNEKANKAHFLIFHSYILLIAASLIKISGVYTYKRRDTVDSQFNKTKYNERIYILYIHTFAL